MRRLWGAKSKYVTPSGKLGVLHIDPTQRGHANSHCQNPLAPSEDIPSWTRVSLINNQTTDSAKATVAQ